MSPVLAARTRNPQTPQPPAVARETRSSGLRIGPPSDACEREADRVAAAVSANGNAPDWPLRKVRLGGLQRQPAPNSTANQNGSSNPPGTPPEPQNYGEGAAKLGEAFLKTDVGKKLKDAASQDPLVKGAEDFVATLPGKIIAGTVAAGAVAALAATHKALPAQIPEIPLDGLRPGLKVKIDYEGPVDRPTKAMITFSYTPQGDKKKPAQTASEKYRAETARIATEQDKFRAGLKYAPGSPEAKQQEVEQKAISEWELRRLGGVLPGTGGRPLVPASAASGPASGASWSFSPLKPDQEKNLGLQPASSTPSGAPQQKSPSPENGRGGEREEYKKTSETMQRKAAGPAEGEKAPPLVDQVLESSGSPLDSSTRAYFEPRFGYDFSRVRIHTNAQAAESARAVNAHAYTVGDHIAFSEGRYAPQSSEGRRLLAHELTHTIQQGHGAQRVPSGASRSIAAPAISRDATHGVARRDSATDAKHKDFDDSVAAGQWERAAEILNGFNSDDIREMLAKLSEMQAASIYVGATNNRAVGPQSNAANMTRAPFLDLNFKENRQTGNWGEAAKYLNGFNKDDITKRVQELTRDEKQALLDGAKANPEAGPASNVAMLAEKALASPSSQASEQAGSSKAAISANSPAQAQGDQPAAQTETQQQESGKAGPEGEQFALDGNVVNSVGRAAFGDTAWPFLKAVFEGFVNGIKGDLKAGRGAQAKSHLRGLFVPWNAAKFYGGYVLGLVLGLLSPITDLVQGIIGIIKLAGSALEWLAKWSPLGVAISPERQQKIATLTQKFNDLAVQFGVALAEFVKDPEGSAKKFSDFLDSMMKLALGKAREMGASAAHSIFDFLNEPYFEMGKSIGKAIGSLIAQILLLIFSEAIGNLISEAASMLGKVADFVAGKAIELIEWVTAFVGKVIGKVRELINSGLKLFKGLFESLIDAFEAIKGLFAESEELAAGLKTAPAGGGELGVVPKGPNVMESRMVTGTRTAPAKVEDLTPPKIHPSKVGETPKAPAANAPPAKSTPTKTPPKQAGQAGGLSPATKERGEDIVEIFEERQRGARASGDLQGDLREELGERRSPGGKNQPQAAERGNFAHQYYEELEGKLLPEAEDLVSEKLPAGLEKEVEVPDTRLSPGKRPRMDRLDRANGVVIEIKPDALREVGQVEAQGYAADMDRFDPLPPPRKWKAKVVTYDAKKVTAFLKKIGYLK